jgi:hypothetical protein
MGREACEACEARAALRGLMSFARPPAILPIPPAVLQRLALRTPSRSALRVDSPEAFGVSAEAV